MDIIDLAEEMAADKKIVRLLSDHKIAQEFYAALCNMRWRKKINLSESEKIMDRLKGVDRLLWSCSWRSAGGIIADIRHNAYTTSEDYLDFYCSGNEGNVSEIVMENLNRIGWEPVKWDE